MKRIPPELHLMILDFALSDKVIYGPRFFPVWPNFALVCRCWRARVQEVAFRNTSILRLQRNPKTKKLVEDGLTELCLSSFLVSVWAPYTHKLGDCLRSLVLHLVPPGQLVSLLQQLPVLESLTLLVELNMDWIAMDKELLTVLPKHTFPSVTGLYIFQSSDPEISKNIDRTLFIPRLVSRFPSVAYLSIEVCSVPSPPMSTWPPGPKNLIAFRSLGSVSVQSYSLISYFVMSASTGTLRVLKLWLISPQDAHRIVQKHGSTLECLTMHAPPKWPKNLTVTWFSWIRHFTNLQSLTLGNFLRARPEMLDIISKPMLRHLEFVHDAQMLSKEVEFLKDCPALVRMTYHCMCRVPELDGLAKERKIEVVYRQWHKPDPKPEPYPDYLILGENLNYSSWKDIALPQPLPSPAVAPRRRLEYPHADQITFHHL
ncbi:hypothetical protein FRC07_006716 [Ceratobasidium sp. 392]|nr:hypothetical protein FRC07_006716 [Ceratobasidium sp. 392]